MEREKEKAIQSNPLMPTCSVIERLLIRAFDMGAASGISRAEPSFGGLERIYRET
jgi:hypothetical protein